MATSTRAVRVRAPSSQDRSRRGDARCRGGRRAVRPQDLGRLYDDAVDQGRGCALLCGDFGAEVAGRIVELPIVDNQLVRMEQLLMVI